VKKFQLHKLVDFGELRVFQDAATFPLLMIISKTRPWAKPLYAPIKQLDFGDLEEEVSKVGYEIGEGALGDEGFTLVGRRATRLLEKIRAAGVPLGEYVDGKIYRGILTGFNEAFVIDRATRDKLIRKDERSAEIIKPFVVGDDVRRYHINFRERYLIFTRRGINIEHYPAIKEHLSQWKKELTPKSSGKDKIGRKPGNYKWYEIQDTIDYCDEFEKPKIIWPVIGKESRFAYDDRGLFHNDKVFFIPSADMLLLALLNSKLVWFFLRQVCSCLGDVDRSGRLELRGIYMEQVPIINKIRHKRSARDNIVNMAEEMLALHEHLAAVRSEADSLLLERQIKATDQKINQLVYELYNLTDEEIRIIEEPRSN